MSAKKELLWKAPERALRKTSLERTVKKVVLRNRFSGRNIQKEVSRKVC